MSIGKTINQFTGSLIGKVGPFSSTGNNIFEASLTVELNPFRRLNDKNRPIRIVGLGDSIMAGDSQPTGQEANQPWLWAACVYSDGKLITTSPYGYGGLTAQGLEGQAYKDTYLESNPDLVIYHLGHNDLPGSGSSFTTPQRTAFRDSVIVQIEKCIAAGSMVIVPELVPLENSSRSEAVLHNNWLSTLPTLYPNWVVYFPGFDLIYNSLDLSFTKEGTHPNKLGHHTLARKFWEWIEPYLEKIPKYSELTSAAGAAGRLYNKLAPATLNPSMGGGYGGGYAESLNTSSGLDTGNSLIVSSAGDGSGVIAWQGATATVANKYIIYSCRVKARHRMGAGRGIKFGGYSDPGQSQYIIGGPLDTLTEWGHMVYWRKCSGTATQAIIQAFHTEIISADTTATGPVEIAQMFMYEADAMQASLGIDFEFPA